MVVTMGQFIKQKKKSLVLGGTETNMNLKTAIQKTDIINQSDDVIKDTIALPWFCKDL